MEIYMFQEHLIVIKYINGINLQESQKLIILLT